MYFFFKKEKSVCTFANLSADLQYTRTIVLQTCKLGWPMCTHGVCTFFPNMVCEFAIGFLSILQTWFCTCAELGFANWQKLGYPFFCKLGLRLIFAKLNCACLQTLGVPCLQSKFCNLSRTFLLAKAYKSIYIYLYI